MVRANDARNHITLYAYDARGNRTSVQDEVSGGGVVLGFISEPGEQDIYQFNGTAGQWIFFDSLASDADDIRVTLTSHNGLLVINFADEDNDIGFLRLPETGIYQLLLFGNGNATGDYNFRFYTPPSTVAPLTLGQPVTGTIEVPGEVDEHTFQATVGDRLVFDSLFADADDLRVNLIDPNGVYRLNFLD